MASNIDFSKIQPYLYQSQYKGTKYFVCVTRKGDISVSFRLQLPEVHTMQEEQYDILHNEINRIIADLPDGVTFHKQDFFFHKKYKGSNLQRENRQRNGTCYVAQFAVQERN